MSVSAATARSAAERTVLPGAGVGPHPLHYGERVEADGGGIAARRARITAFATRCVETRRGSARPWLRHPLASVRTLLDARGLPVLAASPSATAEGTAVRRSLQRSRRTRTAIDAVVSVLPLPATLEQYSQTPARRPVRRKVRVAQREGVVWGLVEDPDERARLHAAADARERSHPDAVYRRDAPANGDLGDHGLWLAARAADGAPLLLAVIPVDGEWAALRYFRTLTDGPQATAARYLLTEALVGELIGRGVRWLADPESPFVLPNGLRHFQRMVGYELFRIELG